MASNSVRTGRQAYVHGDGATVGIRERAVPDPGPGEVLVRVDLAGVCGTDAHLLNGDMDLPAWPAAVGHEGVGVIEQLGGDVDSDIVGDPIVVGDRIYWTGPTPCDRCHPCVVLKDPSRCARAVYPRAADRPSPASFAQFATLPRAAPFVRIPDGTPSLAVIALGCAMPTALAAMRRLGRIATGQSVVIQGAGPVGLASVLLAARNPASRVVCIGAPDARLEVARRLGATHTLSITDSEADDRVARLRELEAGRGADVVIEATGVHSAFLEGLDMLGIEGRYVLVGLYSGQKTVPFNPVRVNNANQTIIGSLGFGAQDVVEAVRVAARHHAVLGLADLVTHEFALNEWTSAVATASRGDGVKVVVRPWSNLPQDVVDERDRPPG